MSRRPLIQDLLVPKLLGALADETYDHAEAVVRTAMAPYGRTHLKDIATMKETAILLRTAVLFVVDHDEVQEVLASAGDAPLTELPPLPFPRVAYECSEDVGWQVYLSSPGSPNEIAARLDIEVRIAAGEEPAYIMDVILVDELIQGRVWNVAVLARFPTIEDGKSDDDRRLVPYQLHADGRFLVHDEKGGLRDESKTHKGGLLRRAPIELAHLVNARGVSLVDLVKRADRRRAARRGFTHPAVYWVDLRSAHETTRGTSDREYHCRWLVRGHWRHLDDTRRTWVRPYVKGPAGAPWKGRPVYKVAA